MKNITTFFKKNIILKSNSPKNAMSEIAKMIDDAKKGNEISFNSFLKKTYIHLKKQLVSLTKSESKAEDIYLGAMQKFWERFVIEDNELPKNPQAYIYIICKNLWLLEKRNAWNRIILKDSFMDHEIGFEESEPDENDEVLMRERSLSIALNAISEKCKNLIEISMDNSVKLMDCMESLGYKTYQALIQAKYNCKKKLIKEVFNALTELKKL